MGRSRTAPGIKGAPGGRWTVVDPSLARAFVEELRAARREVSYLRDEAHSRAATALLCSLEMRCAETADHCDRIARNSATVATTLGLDLEETETISLAGRLHDIGKVGIPDSVLWKAGPLTDGELDAIKAHPVAAMRMLHPAGLEPEVLEIVRAHHERIDGTGYPDGLRGDEIPLGARIVAVADTYDAMRSHRPYRRAIMRKTTLQVMRAACGTHLDREVFDAFLRIEVAEPPRSERTGPALRREAG